MAKPLKNAYIWILNEIACPINEKQKQKPNQPTNQTKTPQHQWRGAFLEKSGEILELSQYYPGAARQVVAALELPRRTYLLILKRRSSIPLPQLS